MAPMIEEPVIKAKKKKLSIVIAAAMAAIFLIAAVAAVLALNADSIKIRKYLKQGNRYLSELDYEEAIVVFEAVIDIEPNNEQAYLGLAEAYLGLEDYEKAIETLDRGLELTNSDRLSEYRVQVQEQWDDAERKFYGYVYATDIDLDDRNNEGISDAYVYVTDESGDTEIYYTDESGFYESMRLEKGTYSLYFYADGYMGCYQKVNLTGGNMNVIFIWNRIPVQRSTVVCR